jgi:ferrous iron transport protein B
MQDVNFKFRSNEIRNSLQIAFRFKTIATKETIKRYQFINDVLKVGLNIDYNR